MSTKDIKSTLTPKDISGMRFNIPLYQRLFAWGEDEIKKLLSDIKTSRAKNYYIGVLSVIYDKSNKCFELIDGQQRFTVIMLMGIAMREYHAPWNAFLNLGDRLNFSGREEDKKFLNDVINHGSSDFVNYEMGNGIKTIKKFLSQQFEKDEDRASYCEKAYESMTFFLSVLPESYLDTPTSLNRYFEVMNTAGRSLEAHEVLKVKLLIGQNNSPYLTALWNAISDFSAPINKQRWNEPDGKYRERFYNENIHHEYSVGDVKDDSTSQMICDIPANPKSNSESGNDKDEEIDGIIVFQEFLLLCLHIFLLRNRENPEKHNQEWFDKKNLLKAFYPDNINLILSDEEVPRFYKLMLRMRSLMDYYLIRRVIRGGAIVDYELLFGGGRDDMEREAAEKLRQYQSMLYSAYIGERYSQWLPEILMWLDDNANNYISPEDLLSEIRRQDNTRHNTQISEESLTYDNVDCYWFSRLDYLLWEKFSFTSSENKVMDITESDIQLLPEEKMAVLKFKFRRNRSIEHLHPQNQKKNLIWDEDVLNSFGNLSLISASFNSTQSNDEVNVKFARIKSQIDRNEGTLDSIKLLVMRHDADGDELKWKEELASRHGARMIKLLKSSLSQP